MQTLEFASRLIKRWGLGLGNLSVDVQQSLLDCCNAGFQDFYRLAPSVYREATITGILVAPQTVNVGVVKGDASFTTFTAPASNFFSTIRIPTDPNTDNIVLPPSALQNAYQGVTGTQPALLFGDTVQLAANIEKIIDEPALAGIRWRLTRNDEYWGREWANFCGPYSGNGVARRVGVPRTYWVEPNAICVGNSPAFVMRVDPLPAGTYNIRFKALFYPMRLSMGNLQTNVTMPFNEAWIESLLIPIILKKMTTNELWSDRSSIAQIVLDDAAARRDIADLSPVIDKPNSRCETEPGW